MSSPKKYNQNVHPSTEVQHLKTIEEQSGNLYKSLYIISRRSNQIGAQIRQELHSKLDEFASSQDNLEEVVENREQIEISRYYERLPKATLLAMDEFKNCKIYFREKDEE